MEPLHRLSMNTSLKNARIFDDDAWDDDGDCPKIKIKIKQEPKDPIKDHVTPNAQISNHIKKEPEEEPDDTFEENDKSFDDAEPTNSSSSSSEDLDSIMEEGELEESYCDTSQPEMSHSNMCTHPKIKVKCETPPPPKIDSFENAQPINNSCTNSQDLDSSNSMEEGELEETHCDTKQPEMSHGNMCTHPKIKIKCETPPPPNIKPDPDALLVDRMFDESPYNKELFNSWKIKEETPIKTENEETNNKRSLKSAKRTVFSRVSPYKKMEDDSPEKKVSAKSRLGPIQDSDEDSSDDAPRPKRRRQEHLETDPAVIARREKQIEYGKNTIGYENYIKMVPRSQRRTEDPQTPPKFGKYSRRGWEGLIKQWRIRLHQYDPPEDTA